jgi:NitT/TauT family transport system ATP-binding protein
MSIVIDATPAIKVEGVTQTYGDPGDALCVMALENASLEVARGELVCLIGPSGCGKSTLLNLMGGLALPASGKIWIDGEPVTGPLPRKVAYVFQENALFPWRTVLDNIKLGMAFQGVPQAERELRARESLEAVGLTDFAKHHPGQLSGGMKQRAQLARALGLRTEILLMDEPFAALDEQTRMVLGEDLSVLLARSKKTIVFVTHSLVEAVFLADRVAVFTARPGRIKQVIPVEEQHPRKRSFMTSTKLSQLRNELYELLHDEIRKTMDIPATGPGSPADDAFAADEGGKA